MITEKILDKVKKVRNLANDSACTPEESANYAAMLQDLLFKHNLNESDLADVENAPFYDKETFDLGVKSPVTKEWRAHLLNAIAENNFCKVLLLGGSFVAIIGTEENREVVKYLYTILEKDIQGMQKNGLKTWAAEFPPVFAPDAKRKAFWTKSFYYGANATISKRLKEQKEANIQGANEQKAGSGTSLAIKVDNALQEALRSFFPVVRQRQTRGVRIDGNGYSSGVQAGNRAELNRSIPQRRIALNV